jgi:hypothetical protein
MLQSPSPCSSWGMPVMTVDMPVDARCQEDRGINAERMYDYRIQLRIFRNGKKRIEYKTGQLPF